MKVFSRILSIVALAALAVTGTQCRSAKQVPAKALEFALIPAGDFMMGDALDGDKDAPPHQVNVSAFFMQKTEVTKAQWDEVRAWGLKNGYTDLREGKGKAADHPVQTISWYDVVKWCNAKSVKDGLSPCYYTDAAQTAVYQTGESNLASTMVKWSANGYRLPTEAEWEKAARGGLSGKRFPLGDTISHDQANFKNEGKESYQKGTTGYHPAYKTGGKPYTSPVASFGANGYGLYDMMGNVSELCWDRGEKYPSGSETDPRGADSSLFPASPVSRVFRGGLWVDGAGGCRVAVRDFGPPFGTGSGIGFRVAHSSVP